MKEKQINFTQKHWNIVISIVIIITGILIALGEYAIYIHIAATKGTLVLSKNESYRLLLDYSVITVIHCIIWFWFYFGYLKRKQKQYKSE